MCPYFQRTLNASRQPLDLHHHHDNVDKQQRAEKKKSSNCNTYCPANSPTISKTNDKSSKIHKQKLESFSSTFECKMWIPEIFANLHWSSTAVLQWIQQHRWAQVPKKILDTTPSRLMITEPSILHISPSTIFLLHWMQKKLALTKLCYVFCFKGSHECDVWFHMSTPQCTYDSIDEQCNVCMIPYINNAMYDLHMCLDLYVHGFLSLVFMDKLCKDVVQTGGRRTGAMLPWIACVVAAE